MVDSVNVVVCFVTSEPLLGAPDAHTPYRRMDFSSIIIEKQK